MILHILVSWRLYHIWVSSRIQPTFIIANSPRARHSLIDQVPKIHCLRSSTFQWTIHFMHRWHFTIKAQLNNVTFPAQFGRFVRNKSPEQSFAVSGQYVLHISIVRYKWSELGVEIAYFKTIIFRTLKYFWLKIVSEAFYIPKLQTALIKFA